jgi:S1-C subfamily serine protease
MHVMTRAVRRASLLAAVVVAIAAATFAGLSSRHSTTVVRQVTVTNTQAVSSTSTLSVGDIYKRAYRGVVQITVTQSSRGPFGGASTAQGSGFVYDTSGDIVTNEHVVDGATSISVKFWNGQTYKATLVGSDISSDLAVIKVAAPSSVLHPLAIGDSTALQIGDTVVAIGSPFGLNESVTSGIVSALHRQITAPNNATINDAIQTDAAINHGNSGGPLLDDQGRVIGVNAQIESDSGGNDGVGFAISSAVLRSTISQLLAGAT